jgi:dTDP-4-dehydro-6-deoxy-alpha-D-glucopyranose 2,3-dehydratase
MNSEINFKIFKSLNTLKTKKSSLKMINEFIEKKNLESSFDLKQIPIENLDNWEISYESKNLKHKSGKFFEIKGIHDENTSYPIIYQPEIGILGILSCDIEGVLHFLMQLKIEPGNVNGVQISPTFQATKSNYSQAHGGNIPMFYNYFNNSFKNVIYSQHFSEQGQRYFQKKNNNTIIYTKNNDIVNENFIWMTLGQLSELSKTPNLINSCARSVLSMLPKTKFIDKPILTDSQIFSKLNSFKQFSLNEKLLTNISQLKDWNYSEGELQKNDLDFKIKGFNISINNREVNSWHQPLLSEHGVGEYGLIIYIKNNVKYVLWKIRGEVGLRDGFELGPTWIKRSAYNDFNDSLKKVIKSSTVLYDNQLSEEGGRFYNSIFDHLIYYTENDIYCLFSDQFLSLTLHQTQRLMNFSDFFTIEARSLWSVYTNEE